MCLLPSLRTHTVETGKLAFDPHCITAHTKNKTKVGDQHLQETRLRLN